MMQRFLQAVSMIVSSLAVAGSPSFVRVRTRDTGSASAAASTSRSNRNRYGGIHRDSIGQPPLGPIQPISEIHLTARCKIERPMRMTSVLLVLTVLSLPVPSWAGGWYLMVPPSETDPQARRAWFNDSAPLKQWDIH